MNRLSDAALQDFIIRGYRVVQPTAPRTYTANYTAKSRAYSRRAIQATP